MLFTSVTLGMDLCSLSDKFTPFYVPPLAVLPYADHKASTHLFWVVVQLEKHGSGRRDGRRS